MDQRLKTIRTLMISISAKRFGVKEQRATTTATVPNLNNRELNMANLRKGLKKLRSHERKTGSGLVEL